ncbi:hypothetical protein CONPUDRAFT_71615 [Coniophora puteana RWD-64-598 SS2]|uniref:Uncharacterized protein n=1 Tax=Coniophora puteana (strain RWD-64-598) TaxID=741705 RepID=A0A5M3MV15_CONPW|nr:uncharacterized protein CONPUDRAFT_71615 [Coniophora puteana RWD-64-598 SS2]EIW82956.1 hypothetical protein CONPUDRAFT_71615 [Coniophora puteana RWD-64-598 SS2]
MLLWPINIGDNKNANEEEEVTRHTRATERAALELVLCKEELKLAQKAIVSLDHQLKMSETSLHTSEKLWTASEEALAQTSVLYQIALQDIKAMETGVADAWRELEGTRKEVEEVHRALRECFVQLLLTLLWAGCAQYTIGKIIQKLYNTVGIKIEQKTQPTFRSTHPTQGRNCIAAADFRRDEGSHSSKHATLTTQHTDGSVEHQIRFLGVESTLGHSSARQAEDWKKKVHALAALYNKFEEVTDKNGNKPTFSAIEFTHKLMGMYGDHAADQKAMFKLIQN